MRKYKYSYMAASSNFDLEPVIQSYFEKYPEAQYQDYDVVFRTRDEHMEGLYSYLIVFTLANPRANPTEKVVSLYNYLKTYIEYQNNVEMKGLVLAMQPHSNVLPQPGSQQGHTFGKLHTKK